MKKFNPAVSAILDYLCEGAEKGFLPATINAPEVTWIWTNLNGRSYGITAPMAQAIMIIADKFENVPAGFLKCIKESDSGYGYGRIIL